MAFELIRRFDPKVRRFILVGGANTVLTLCIYSAIVLFGESVSVAVIISAVCGVAFSSVINSRYTFERRSVKHALLFWAVYMITVSANIVLLNFLINQFEFNKILTQVFLVPIFAVATFLLLGLSDATFFSRGRVAR